LPTAALNLQHENVSISAQFSAAERAPFPGSLARIQSDLGPKTKRRPKEYFIFGQFKKTGHPD
jgi:hypothetical protein